MSKRLSRTVAVVAAIIGFADGAHAQSAGSQPPAQLTLIPIARTVVLKNGRRYYGAMVENVPGSHVRLRLSSGEMLTFVMDTVAELRAPRPGEENLEAPVQENRAPVAPPGSPDTWVRAHLVDEGVKMEAGIDSSESNADPDELVWSAACKAPCGEWVGRHRWYRLQIPEVGATHPFRLFPAQSASGDSGARPLDVEIRYLPSRRSMYIAGVVLVIAGPHLAFAGLITAIVGALPPTKDSLVSGGGALLGTGLISTAVGIGLFVAGRNRVEVTPRSGEIRLTQRLSVSPSGLHF